MNSHRALRLGCIVLALGASLRAQEETEPAADRTTAHPIEGSWRWTFTMPDGTTTQPKLVLSLDNGKLRGTTRFRPDSEIAITNAFFNGSELGFQVIRKRDGRDIVTSYSGKWSDKEIRGTIESNWAGEKQKFDWLAQRAHFGAEGTWQWTNYFGRRDSNNAGEDGGGRRRRGFVSRVELEQNGEVLTGSMPGWRRGQRTEIKNGTITNGVIYFETEREFGGEKIVSKYTGRQAGDVIKGSIETIMADGEERKADWDAKRVD